VEGGLPTLFGEVGNYPSNKGGTLLLGQRRAPDAPLSANFEHSFGCRRKGRKAGIYSSARASAY
jgi:hypothetical protein